MDYTTDPTPAEQAAAILAMAGRYAHGQRIRERAMNWAIATGDSTEFQAAKRRNDRQWLSLQRLVWALADSAYDYHAVSDYDIAADVDPGGAR
jgi:hypothetical protein